MLNKIVKIKSFKYNQINILKNNRPLIILNLKIKTYTIQTVLKIQSSSHLCHAIFADGHTMF